MFLFFDTETTGLLDSRKDLADDCQPYIVQLCALLTDEKGEVVNKFRTLIEPTNWEIDEEATALHGVTTDDCHKYGIPFLSALSVFNMMVKKSNLVVAHNIDFDSKMMKIESLRYKKPHRLADAKTFCTMLKSTDILKLPSKFGNKFKKDNYKWPSLEESSQFFFNKPVADAHDAEGDTIACKEIFFELMERGYVNKEGVVASVPPVVLDKVASEPVADKNGFGVV